MARHPLSFDHGESVACPLSNLPVRVKATGGGSIAWIWDGLMFLAISGNVLAESHNSLPILTSTAQVHRLTGKQARGGYPIHLRAVVTYFDALSPDLFVQDETGGIFIDWSPKMPKVSVGDLLNITGISTQVDFAPDIANARWNVMGRAPMPIPRRVTFGQMASTSEDARWVEVEGILRQASHVHRSATERVLLMN